MYNYASSPSAFCPHAPSWPHCVKSESLPCWKLFMNGFRKDGGMEVVCCFSPKRSWPNVFLLPDWVGCTLYCEYIMGTVTQFCLRHGLILQMKKLRLREVLPGVLWCSLAFSVPAIQSPPPAMLEAFSCVFYMRQI